MRTSSSINCFFDRAYKVPVATQIQRMADAGFRVLDMNFWDWCHEAASPFTSDGWRDWVAGIRACADRLGLAFTQAHGHVYNFYREPDAPEKYELYRRSIIGAGMLGIRWVVFHPSQSPDYEAPGNLERMIEDNYAFFAPLVELAGASGVGLAFENMSYARSGLVSADELIELVDRFKSDRVGICWDTGHAHISGADQTASIATMGARLKALHVQDNGGVTDDHTAPYYGSIDWPPIMRALHGAGYAGDFTFEAHMLVRSVPEGAQADAARLLHRIGEELVALAGRETHV